jgi:hypothetical protein
MKNLTKDYLQNFLSISPMLTGPNQRPVCSIRYLQIQFIFLYTAEYRKTTINIYYCTGYKF